MTDLLTADELDRIKAAWAKDFEALDNGWPLASAEDVRHLLAHIAAQEAVLLRAAAALALIQKRQTVRLQRSDVMTNPTTYVYRVTRDESDRIYEASRDALDTLFPGQSFTEQHRLLCAALASPAARGTGMEAKGDDDAHGA